MDKAFPSPREAYHSGYEDGQAEAAEKIKALEQRMADMENSLAQWVEEGQAIVNGGGTAFRIGMWWAKRPKLKGLNNA